MSGRAFSCAYDPLGSGPRHAPGATTRGAFSLAVEGGGAIYESPATRALCFVDGELDATGLAAELGADPGLSLEELLCAGHRRLGSGLLTRLRGTFCLVVWDGERGTGVLAVDPLGSRPLFGCVDGGRLLLASELPPLLRLRASRPAPDPGALGRWLAGELLHPRETLYEGVWRLEGGHAVHLDSGRWERRRYWAPRYRPSAYAGPREAADALRLAVAAAVGRRLEPDGTALLLSGGLDSSSAAGAARPQSEALGAYSVVFPDDPEVDESQEIDLLARELALPSTRVRFRGASLLEGALEYLRDWETPALSPTFAFMLPLLRLAAADGFGTVLDGEGGDELFGLSPYLLADRLRPGRLAGVVSLVRAFPDAGPRPPLRTVRLLLRAYAVGGALSPRAEAAVVRLRGRRDGEHPWLSPATARATRVADSLSWKALAGPRWWAYLADSLTAGRARMGVHDLLRRRAALAGLEARHPFLDDLDLVELVLSLPPELAFDARNDRPLLRAAMAGIVPDAVRLRPRKSDFLPIFRRGLAIDRPHLESLLAAGAEVRAYLRPGAVEEALRRAGPEVDGAWAWRIWRLATAECWLRAQADASFAERALTTWSFGEPELEVARARPSAEAVRGNE